MKHPIDNITWLPAGDLDPNDYNPNVVFGPEMKLLEFSILHQGWLQPILITDKKVIIDGFHRYTLALNSPEVKALTGGKIPCAVLNLTEPERMLLTIRINRAKGAHIAVKMHDIAVSLVEDHGLSVEKIAAEIGATKDEVELLLMDGVFKKFDTRNHKFSKAWYPKR
jgi:ParB-like chromosome segregation protein Spo0J